MAEIEFQVEKGKKSLKWKMEHVVNSVVDLKTLKHSKKVEKDKRKMEEKEKIRSMK